jgi:prophage regulatory protein
MTKKILRLPEVLVTIGLSRSSVYEAIFAGTFSKPVKIGLRAVGWLSSDVDDWISQRIAQTRGIDLSRDALNPSCSSEGVSK